MRTARHLLLPLALASLAIALIGCTPPAPSVNPAADAERNRAATQRALSAPPPSSNPQADRNSAVTQQGLGAAGVPNPNPPGPGR